MTSLKKQNILITGATSGLGKKLSIYFNSRSRRVICTGKTPSKIKTLKKILNNKRNTYFCGDLSDTNELNLFIRKLKKLEQLNVIIHCLGGGLGIKEDLINEENFIKLMKVNLISISQINNQVIKMKKKKNKCTIIHVSSVASLESTASIGYSSAKAALNVYSKILSKKFISKNIFVKNIMLGAFETDDNSFGRLRKKNIKAYNNFKKLRLPRKKYASDKDIIPIIEFLIDPKSNILSGNEIITDFSELNSFRN